MQNQSDLVSSKVGEYGSYSFSFADFPKNAYRSLTGLLASYC